MILLRHGTPPRARRTLATVLLLAATGCSDLSPRATSGDAATLGWAEVEGDPVPLPAGTPLSERGDDPSRSRERWTLVNFWSSTCVPCRKEIPMLNEVAKHPEVDVAGVSWDVFAKYARAFEDEVGSEFPSWHDPDMELATAFTSPRQRVHALPTSLLMKDGAVVAVHLGPFDTADDVLDRLTP